MLRRSRFETRVVGISPHSSLVSPCVQTMYLTFFTLSFSHFWHIYLHFLPTVACSNVMAMLKNQHHHLEFGSRLQICVLPSLVATATTQTQQQEINKSVESCPSRDVYLRPRTSAQNMGGIRAHKTSIGSEILKLPYVSRRSVVVWPHVDSAASFSSFPRSSINCLILLSIASFQ
jgi:hypothetical protein